MVRTPDVPANPSRGRAGDGLYAYAQVEVGPDGGYKNATREVAPFGTFMKGELVRLTLDVKTSPTFIVQTAYRHNVTRGVGAFQHESAEPLSLHIEAQSSHVPCEVLTGVIARLFEKADDGTVAGWEKTHPEIVSGVIIPAVREGMTPADVEALFGAPERRAEIGPKLIYFYPKMRVTFTAGKVTGVE